jgi:hypothetical protein
VDAVPAGLVDAGGAGDDELLDDDGASVTWVVGFDEVAGAEVGAGAVLLQLAVGVAVVCVLAVGLALGLELCAGGGVAVSVTVTVTGGAVTVVAPLGVAVPPVVSVAGAVLRVAGGVELLGFVTFCEAGAGVPAAAGDDVHVGTAAGCEAPPGTRPADAPLTDPGPEPLALDEPDGGFCEVKPCSTEWNMPARIGGTAASTTPTANTAKPTAKAGRSIASRQSRGRCGAGRACPGFALRAVGAAGRPRSACQRRIRAARNPELAAACDSLAVT